MFWKASRQGDNTFDMFIVKDFGNKKHCKNVFTDDKSRLPLRRQVRVKVHLSTIGKTSSNLWNRITMKNATQLHCLKSCVSVMAILNTL